MCEHLILSLSLPYSWSSYEGDDGDNACGVEAEDDEYWYMGFTECFRANTAYSLYGVKKGDEDKGCNRNSFINSFFTTAGVETFTQAMQEAGVSFSGDQQGDGGEGEGDNEGGENGDYAGGVSSYCYSEAFEDQEQEDNQNDDEGQDENQDNNGNNGYVHNQKVYEGTTSYGVGCSGKKYVEKTFNGAYCNNKETIEVTNTLQTFNSDIQAAQCVKIYSSNDQEGEDGGGGGDGENNQVDLLYYSSACDVREYPGQCPDPHGKLKTYYRSVDATSMSASSTSKSKRRERVKKAFTWIMLILGILMMITAFCQYNERNGNNDKKGGSVRRSTSSSTNRSTSSAPRKSWWQRLTSTFRRKK